MNRKEIGFVQKVDESIKIDDETLVYINTYKIMELQNKAKQYDKLKEKYNNALELLLEYNLPCEIDGFMDKNVDYCSKNCGVDDKVFKKCWDKYIEGIIYKK